MSRRILGLLLGAATLLAIASAVYVSLNPKNYFFYAGQDRSQWTHPTGHLVFVCTLMLLEGLFVSFVLLSRRPQRLWHRSLLGLCLFLPWAMFSSLLVMHMPLYVIFHHLWAWTLVLALVLTCFGSSSAALWRRLRRTSSESRRPPARTP